MAGQQFTLTNTNTGAATGTVAFRVYVPWARGQYSSISALRLAEKVRINGVNYDTFWESFGAPHWDGSIHHTYAVFRYNLAAGTASPTSPQVTGEIVQVSNAVSPASFPSWASDIDIDLDLTEDDPNDTNVYSFALGDIARGGTNGSAYEVENVGGSRYVFFSGWTGNGDHSSVAPRRTSSDPAHTSYAGNLHVYAWLELRDQDTHGLLEVYWANDAAYPSPATAPDAVAYPLNPAQATCATDLDQDMRRWIDAMELRISSPSATLYSAPIGINDYSTGVGPTGTIAPSGAAWTIPIEGLGWGGGWARSWMVSSVSAADAQTKATHFGTLYGYPKIQTAQAHRRQRNLRGYSMQMAGYRWAVVAGMTEAIANEGFAQGPGHKASWYATNRDNPYWFPAGHGFGSGGGTYMVLGECPSPFGQMVYCGSPWHTHVAYLRTIQDASVLTYHKELEALEGLSTLWDSTTDLGFTGFWDGEDLVWTSQVQFGLRQNPESQTLARYNGNTVQTNNPDTRYLRGYGGIESPQNRNAEHFGTLHLFWTTLITGSRMCRHFLKEKGFLAARQLHGVNYANRNPSFPRAEARLLDAIDDAREIAVTTSTQRDELLLIGQRRAAAHTSLSGPGSWAQAVYGMANDQYLSNARRFGLSTEVIESIANRQYYIWQMAYLGWSCMRLAFGKPEDPNQTDYAETIAQNIEALSRVCTEQMTCLDPAGTYQGTQLPAAARRTMDGWFAARAAELGANASRNGMFMPKSRGVDRTQSSGSNVVFGDYVVDLGPRNDAQNMQAGGIWMLCLAFRANVETPGLNDRAQAVIARLSAEFPGFANGREYFGALGTASGYITGSTGPSGPISTTDIQSVPPMPIEGEDPIDPSNFGGTPPTPVQYGYGESAIFYRPWQPIAPVQYGYGAEGIFTRGSGGGPGQPGGPIDVYLAAPMDEPEDVRCFLIAPSPLYGEAVLTGPGLVPVYHGMRRSSEPVAMEVSERKLYVANGLVRPIEYGPHGAAYAGVTAPAGEIPIGVERQSVGLREQGATQLAGDLSGGAITNITGYRFSADDIGKLVYTGARKDYLGVVSAVTAFNSITVTPATLTAASAAPIWLYATKTTDDTPDSGSWENALELLPYSTPYSEKRPRCDGTPAAGDDNPLCLQFRGLQAIRVEGIEAQLEQDSVIDFKCYLKAEKLETQGGGRIVVWSRYSNDLKASFELSIVENGKLEFRFWDVNLTNWRSIRTVGTVLTIDEWYYLRLRYKFKNAGGWEPDDRNILRSTTSFGQARYHRDGLWVWSMEGHRPADRFLVVAGARASFNRGTPAAYNTSREIGNVGYLQSDPWIGPRKGDQGFDNTITISEDKPVMMRANRSATFTLTLHTSTDFFPQRWMSANRDEPYDLTNDGGSQLNDIQANYYTGGTTPVSAGSAVLTNHGRALLCYVYGPRSGTAFTTPRILAVVSVGSTDLDTNTANSSDTSTILLSNSVALGADGLAENVAGGDITTGDLIVAFAFPNGSNHAAAATGNTTPIPTLLVQGEHPVGTNDAPMNLGGPVFIAGIDRNEQTITGEGRAETRDSARINFVGRMDDVGFKIGTLVQATDEYTSDHMPPDHQFNGPADTRLMCLPPLDFTGQQAQYDIGSNQTTGNPTWASKLDALRGRKLVSTTGSEPQARGELVGFATQQGGEGQKAHGRHKVAVTFYDPLRDHESPPSEIGEVVLQSKPDEFEPDAERTVVIEQLPVSAEVDRPIYRRVYLTLPDGDTFFRALEIRDNTTSRARVVVDTVTLVNQPRIDFGYQVPPVSRFLASSESRMFYGGILDAPAAVYWSDALRPWQVPGRAEVLEASDGGYVTGIKVLNGTPYVFSRAAIFVGQEVGEDLIRWARIQANTGTVSHWGLAELEDALFFPDAKGVFAFDGTGRVTALSGVVDGTYRSLDPIALKRSYGAYSRRRDQYLLTCAERRQPYQTELLTLEAGAPPIWSREVHSQGLSSLLGGSDPRTDERQVYAGTPSGFVMELDAGDRPRGQYDGELYGVLTATVLGGGGSYFVTLDVPAFDDALDGIAGVPYLITRTTAGHTVVVDRGFAWRFDGVRVHTMSKVAAGVQYGDQFWLGGWAMIWESKAFDYRAGTMRKQLQAVDLVFDQEEGGLLELTTHADFTTEATASKSCPMDRGFDLPHVSTHGAFTTVKLLKVCQRPARVHNLALRVQVETQRGGGDGSAT